MVLLQAMADLRRLPASLQAEPFDGIPQFEEFKLRLMQFVIPLLNAVEVPLEIS